MGEETARFVAKAARRLHGHDMAATTSEHQVTIPSVELPPLIFCELLGLTRTLAMCGRGRFGRRCGTSC